MNNKTDLFPKFEGEAAFDNFVFVIPESSSDMVLFVVGICPVLDIIFGEVDEHFPNFEYFAIMMR